MTDADNVPSTDGVAAPTAGARTALRSTNVVGDAPPRPDFYAIDEFLTDEERRVRDLVSEFVDAEVLPIIAGYWERGEFPMQLVRRVSGLGIVGGSIRGYECPGLSAVAEGLVIIELARGDASVNAFFGVTGGAMTTIAACGSEEQKERWLPQLARLEKTGAFALTEPYVGSDAAHVETRVHRDGDAYVLDGAKRWIGNALLADIMIVWARDPEGKMGAYLVEKGTPGVEATFMAGKAAMRANPNADVIFTAARVPLENRLPRADDFRTTRAVLTRGRYNVACGALGQAVSCYEAALSYTTKRHQFGKPVASFQLVQQKLVWMLTEITAMQLLTWRLGKLLDEDRMTPEQASLAKLNNAAKARQIAAAARDVMGANGILLENRVARQQADIEATYSYEGTDHIQTLIIGREITGIPAFV